MNRDTDAKIATIKVEKKLSTNIIKWKEKHM